MVLGGARADRDRDPGAEAVFPVVLGCVRSGTTMLRAVLNAHPILAVPPESYFVAPALEQRARYEGGGAMDVDALLADIAADRSFPDWQLSPDALAEVRSEPRATVPDALLALYRAYAHQHDKPRAGDKTPSHLLQVGLLADSFPTARFVHIVRDGRDVVPSILGMQFGPDRFAEGVLFWQRRVERGRAAGAALGAERYREIRYEALVADPESVMREVCPFFELDYAPEMLRYHERADDLLDGLRATRHVQGVRKPPTQGVRDWRTALAPHEVQLFEALAGDTLDVLGYERSGLSISSRVRVEAQAIRVVHELDRRTLTFRTRVAAQALAPAPTGRRGGLSAMRITMLGHAGLFIETDHGSILCDPWFHPAFFASWIPFPDNSTVDIAAISNPDYLYISHSHDDHLDRRFLAEHVSKDAVVILPDYPTDDHRRTLEELGFHDHVQTRNDVVLDLGGLRVLTNTLIAPTDGAIGDSGLAVADSTATVFNQNDSKPIDFDALNRFGPFDAHFVQFSGAIWYPMAYRLPAEEKEAMGRRKRANQLSRAARMVKEIDATEFFPFAGPPCFLDEALFHLNDLGTDDSNIFLDQRVALEHMQSTGVENGVLTIPGTVIELVDGGSTVTHPVPDDDVMRPFVDKERYLREYQARVAPVIDAEKATWPDHELDLLRELAEWWDPLLAASDQISVGVNGRVLLQTEDEAIVVDFLDRRVKPWNDEICRFRFYVPRALVESCVARREVDWVNSLFLSCRFEAERDGPYNEFVYNFFRSLSAERTAYTEQFYAATAAPMDTWEAGGYVIQRRCPHLKADLTRFGTVDDGILTCEMHGWRFELATGRCLTSDDRRLWCEPLDT